MTAGRRKGLCVCVSRRNVPAFTTHVSTIPSRPLLLALSPLFSSLSQPTLIKELEHLVSGSYAFLPFFAHSRSFLQPALHPHSFAPYCKTQVTLFVTRLFILCEEFPANQDSNQNEEAFKDL